jgi:hypothetical protein
LASLVKTLGSLEPQVDVQPSITIAAPDTTAFSESLKEMKHLYDNVLSPLVTANYRKLKLDHSIWDNLKRMNDTLKKLEKTIPED